MKRLILKTFEKLGYSVTKIDTLKYFKEKELYIKEKEFWDIYSLCKPYTMTSVERMYALYNSVNYILTNNIKGDFVECGVYRGGSSMLIAKMLSNRSIIDRKIYLYDTFEGMPTPTSKDIDLKDQMASKMFEEKQINKSGEASDWCLTDLSDVKENMKLTLFATNQIVFVKGKVEDTIPKTLPNQTIALLRLDTDWYESTKHELVYLFPLLETNGVLIIDDYGHWKGCRQAVDEYFNENKISFLLNRIDYTGRIGTKNYVHK